MGVYLAAHLPQRWQPYRGPAEPRTQFLLEDLHHTFGVPLVPPSPREPAVREEGAANESREAEVLAPVLQDLPRQRSPNEPPRPPTEPPRAREKGPTIPPPPPLRLGNLRISWAHPGVPCGTRAGGFVEWTWSSGESAVWTTWCAALVRTPKYTDPGWLSNSSCGAGGPSGHDHPLPTPFSSKGFSAQNRVVRTPAVVKAVAWTVAEHRFERDPELGVGFCSEAVVIIWGLR